ncbi:hypothetical protein [Phenylobacterium montanum]|uniref:DUF1330 domain-containing protein n=1 Tax=Phenylobacterium montanum TaxID=2823693 RepID=A0A975IWS7_9CAUL|nr:hypothetical protein [Caulobacter sp. S6]QUD88681.1 hypothetical protein KCG34_01985 [Caulobacter sp. S6]
MKIVLTGLLASAALLAAPMAASAQDAARPYDNGPVWDVAAIQTKPGHFDDYMRFVATVWKARQEALKAKGVVLDYKVLTVQDQRDNEPDLFLMVEYKNMAAFDVPLDDFDAMAKKEFGSVTASAKAAVDRETIRTQRGDIITRELILK